jgi:MFS family permease
VSSASLILTDGGLALSEPKTVGARGGTEVLAASSLGGCLVFVSSAVVTVALAAIGRDMRLSPFDLQWVMNAELLPLAALTLVAGALGDRFGQKRVFLGGIALYGLGAAAIGFAPLIVGRFLKGPGEAVILPNGLSVLGQAFPADKKACAVGIWSAAAAVASGVAPAIAGAILDHGSWRTTFLMLLPVVVGALAVGAVWIPKDFRPAMIRGVHLSTPMAGLGIIPLQVLTTVACVLPCSRCSLSSRGPTSTSSRETEPLVVRAWPASPRGNNEEPRHL